MVDKSKCERGCGVSDKGNSKYSEKTWFGVTLTAANLACTAPGSNFGPPLITVSLCEDQTTLIAIF